MNNNTITIDNIQRIEQILLQTLDFREVVQKVVDGVLVELTKLDPNYRIAVLTLKDDKKKVLKRLSLSQTKEAKKTLEASKKNFYDIIIPLSYKNNIAIQAINTKAPVITHDFKHILYPALTIDEAHQVQKHAGIKTSIAYPVNVKGKATGAMIFSKITESKKITKVEDKFLSYFTNVAGLAVDNARTYTKLEEKSMKLRVANRELKTLDKRKDEFISIASHELKTPISIIKQNLWMLQNTPKSRLSERETKFIIEMDIGLERLRKIVNNLLDISRIQQGRLMFNYTDYDLYDVVENSLLLLDKLAQKKHLNLIHPKKIIADTTADKEKTQEVIDNLVGNAIKYTERGKIAVEITDDNTHWKVSVTDTGPGIKQEDYGKIFTKFGRAQEGLKQLAPGSSTGLGLYIAKNFVEHMNGHIGFTSEFGKGTTFWFTLPKSRQKSTPH